jgi:hypothetical protein
MDYGTYGVGFTVKPELTVLNPVHNKTICVAQTPAHQPFRKPLSLCVESGEMCVYLAQVTLLDGI